MNKLLGLSNKNTPTSKNKLLPLGITVETKHIHPKIPRKEILYNVQYPGFQKKLVKIKHYKKTGIIDVTFRILPPKIIKSKSKNTKQNGKQNTTDFGGCTKKMIANINVSHMSNVNKLRAIQNKCKLK